MKQTIKLKLNEQIERVGKNKDLGIEITKINESGGIVRLYQIDDNKTLYKRTGNYNKIISELSVILTYLEGGYSNE